MEQTISSAAMVATVELLALSRPVVMQDAMAHLELVTMITAIKMNLKHFKKMEGYCEHCVGMRSGSRDISDRNIATLLPSITFYI